jgi:hypothetical protein
MKKSDNWVVVCGWVLYINVLVILCNIVRIALFAVSNNIDDIAKSRKKLFQVIPVKTGIKYFQRVVV